jgi:dihydroflavonol-4-reductase
VTQTLVTGGSGFVGQHLVAALLARGRNVRVLDLRDPVCAPAGVQYVKGSILDAKLVVDTLDDVEEVYHLAALPGMWMRRKDDFHDVNCRGTEIVIAAARARGVTRFLHCSTESILFGSSNADPVVTENVRATPDDMPGAYTRSKMMAERQAMEAAAAGYPVRIANPTMPIGPHHGNLTPPTLMLQYFISRKVQIYLDFVLNLVDVRDVAAGMLLVMERGEPGQRYILGGEDISLRRLLEALDAIRGRKALRVKVPEAVAYATAAMMEFVADYVSRQPPSATTEGVLIASRSKPLSIEKSRRELGYAPRPIEQALRDALASIAADAR